MKYSEEFILKALAVRSKMNSKIATKMVVFDYAKEHSISVVLYETEIFKLKGRKVTLKHGGYKTATTKRRINQLAEKLGLEFRVWSEQKDWSVYFYAGNKKTIDWNKEQVTFTLPKEVKL